MENRESGFSTAFALTVIFSLCLITFSAAMISAVNDKKINSYKKALEERKEAVRIILKIEEVIQAMKETSCDPDIYGINSLIASVCSYDFTVKDISTGINKNFISRRILESKPVNEYISVAGVDVFTEYGWINPEYADKEFLEDVKKDFDNNSIFPLVNRLPPLNIYFMDTAFIKTVFDWFKIKDSRKKAELIVENLKAETDVKELAAVLDVNENHPVFNLIGFKTLFWKVAFETKQYSCNCVFAAISEADSPKKIEKYILIEKEILHKGGL